MFVEKGSQFLVSVSLNQLEKLYAEENNVKAKIRLQCAVLRKKGNSQPFIAEVTGKPVTTVSDILRRFEKRGIKGCYAIRQKGQPKKLSIKQRWKLKRTVSNSPIKEGLPFVNWTTKLVQYFIGKYFKINYTLRQVANILKSFRYTLQKPRPEHIKANKKLQAQFKKKFDGELKSFGSLDMRSYFWTKAPSASSHIS